MAKRNRKSKINISLDGDRTGKGGFRHGSRFEAIRFRNSEVIYPILAQEKKAKA